jgi:hypothetical protein
MAASNSDSTCATACAVEALRGPAQAAACGVAARRQGRRVLPSACKGGVEANLPWRLCWEAGAATMTAPTCPRPLHLWPRLLQPRRCAEPPRRLCQHRLRLRLGSRQGAVPVQLVVALRVRAVGRGHPAAMGSGGSAGCCCGRPQGAIFHH